MGRKHSAVGHNNTVRCEEHGEACRNSNPAHGKQPPQGESQIAIDEERDRNDVGQDRPLIGEDVEGETAETDQQYD